MIEILPEEVLLEYFSASHPDYDEDDDVEALMNEEDYGDHDIQADISQVRNLSMSKATRPHAL